MSRRFRRSAVVITLFASMMATAARSEEPSQPDAKVLRAGMIGLTTSHVVAFSRALNDPKATGVLAQVEVVAGFTGGIEDNPSSWDRREKYTKTLSEMGIPIYDSVAELLGKVDVVLLEEVDGRPHLGLARQVIEAGKPLFIDKPLAGSLADCITIFRLAEEKGVPCFSSSSLRFSSGFQAVRNGPTSFGKIQRCTAWSPMSIEPHHPDLFWYGIHGCEILFTIMGPGCVTVTRDSAEQVTGQWDDGRTGTFVAKKGYGAEVVGSEGSGEAGTYEGYQPLVQEICEFFITGQEPVSKRETLEIYTFMEAADESKRQDGKPVSMEDVFRKAEATAGSAQR